MGSFLDRVLGWFSTDMGIDLGTANTLVYVQGQGIVCAEPSVVAVHAKSGHVLMNGDAVGDNAKGMIGKVHPNIKVIRPLKEGVIADVEITEAMLSYFIRKVHNRRWGVKPALVVSVPIGINNVEKRAVYNSAERAGAREVLLVEQPFAAAIGAGLPVGEAMGSMIVDVGGGTTDIAVLALAGIVQSETLEIAGDHMDDAIMEYISQRHGLEIGNQMAERIKIEIGSAAELEEEMAVRVRGRDVQTKLPGEAEITSMEIREALRPCTRHIIEGVLRVLERTPPELSADLVERGIVMAGGAAQLRGIDRAIQQAIGLPVRVCDEPIGAVARGTGVIIESLDLFADVLEDAAEAA